MFVLDMMLLRWKRENYVCGFLCYCLSFLYSGTQYFRIVEPNNNNDNNNKKKMYGLYVFNENIYEFVATIRRCLLSCDIWSTNFMWAGDAELLFHKKFTTNVQVCV